MTHGFREGRGFFAPLDQVHSTQVPSGPLPPGPRVNAWERTGAVSDEPPVGVRELVDGLWHPGELHRAEDGTATSIHRRPVPSAGACYPVQTHLVDADGRRWAVDHDRGLFLRRDPHADRADGWPSNAPGDGIARVVFTVQPGRSFGRYRHRAWPLWIADTAYAVAAVRFLLGARAGRGWFGPSALLRGLLGVPRASDVDSWLGRGLVPEIPLAAVELPRAPVPADAARRALGTRRSPATSEFAARTPAPAQADTPDQADAPDRACAPDQADAGDQADRPSMGLISRDGLSPRAEVEHLARASGQTWVRGASAVRSWSVPTTASASIIGTALWNAHLAAAGLCYRAALDGDCGVRPVSGFSSTRGRWILHAVAFLDSPGGSR